MSQRRRISSPLADDEKGDRRDEDLHTQAVMNSYVFAPESLVDIRSSSERQEGVGVALRPVHDELE
jgi:hypothetical protein